MLALYRDGGNDGRDAGGGAAGGGAVVAWAVALPDGAAVVVPLDAGDNRPILTTVRGLRRRWAPLLRATLVRVSGREVLNRAA